MNNLFEYLDKQKVQDELLSFLKISATSADTLWIDSLRVLDLQKDRIILGVPSQRVVDALKSAGLIAAAQQFFQNTFYDNSFDLLFDVIAPRQPEMIQKTLQQPAEKTDTPLNSSSALLTEFTFDTFIMGPTNEFAYHSAKSVAANPGSLQNPLFIWGEVGLGKTHLLHAIGHRILESFPEKTVRYISCQTYLDDYVGAIQKKSFNELRKLRGVDVLLMDDVQILANKEGFQDECFYTMQELFMSHKQIVFAADRHPDLIEGIKDRILSRLKAGIMADIKLPNLEMRIAILQNLSQKFRVRFDPENEGDLLEHLASAMSSNVRELRGAFINIMQVASFRRQEFIDRNSVEDGLHSYLNKIRSRLTLETIYESVAREYGIERSELGSESREQRIAYPRQVAMYLTRELTPKGLKEIGQSFGKDHGTVIHALKKIKEAIKTNPAEAQRIQKLQLYLEKNFER